MNDPGLATETRRTPAMDQLRKPLQVRGLKMWLIQLLFNVCK